MIFTLLFSLSAIAAPEFLVEYQGSGGAPPFRASLVVMDDGAYVFESSSGGWARCASPQAGKFTGKLAEKDLTQLRDDVKNLKKACNELGICEAPKARPSGAFWLVKAGSETTVVKDGDKLPKLLGRVLDLSLRQEPLSALEISVSPDGKGFLATLKNIGKRELKLPPGDFSSSGKRLDTKGKALTLTPGASAQLTLSGVVEGLVSYDNSVEAHHLDSEAQLFQPCASVGKN